MRYKFTCLECEHEFDVPKLIEERHGMDTAPFETINVCPNCLSEYYVPSTYCDLCGRAILDEYIITLDDENICENCYIKRNIHDAR